MMGQQDFSTESLNRTQKKIAEVILKVVRETWPDACGGGCRAFYSPREWRQRGEEYGTDSLLVVVHDGGDMAYFFDWMCESVLREKMDAALREVGYYAEQCTCWYSAIYEAK